MSTEGKGKDVGRRLDGRYRRLEVALQKRPPAAVVARFTEIDGGTQGALVSIELFTTIIPIIIIGFGYFSGFAKNASPATVLIREMGLEHPLSLNPPIRFWCGRVRGRVGFGGAPVCVGSFGTA